MLCFSRVFGAIQAYCMGTPSSILFIFIPLTAVLTLNGFFWEYIIFTFTLICRVNTGWFIYPVLYFWSQAWRIPVSKSLTSAVVYTTLVQFIFWRFISFVSVFLLWLGLISFLRENQNYLLRSTLRYVASPLYIVFWLEFFWDQLWTTLGKSSPYYLIYKWRS